MQPLSIFRVLKSLEHAWKFQLMEAWKSLQRDSNNIFHHLKIIKVAIYLRTFSTNILADMGSFLFRHPLLTPSSSLRADFQLFSRKSIKGSLYFTREFLRYSIVRIQNQSFLLQILLHTIDFWEQSIPGDQASQN